jgi:HK97 family phage major capsid protein
LVQNQYGPMIEILNNATVLGKLGITTMNGVVGDLILPQQTGGATAYWVSETGALTDSQATFAQKAMVPHRSGATIPFTTQFLAQSSISAEAFLRGELMTRLALLQDLAGLEGTGNAGQPLGLKNTPGINNTVTFGGAATWDDVVEFETGIAVDNADIGSMGFALSAATVGKWKTILRSATAGAVYLIDKGDLNGYGYERTNQITGNIAYFGVWAQLLLARWAGMEFIVDPYALKKSGQIEITVNQLCDYLVRQPLAFNVSTDSAAQ